VSQITIDEFDQKWIVSPKGNGLFVLNSGASIDNAADDSWRYFRQGKGQEIFHQILFFVPSRTRMDLSGLEPGEELQL
jgi:hypothetical protein